MSKKSDLIFVEHILESICAIEDFSSNINKKGLITDRLRQSAIIREIEVIGEAAKNISQSVKEKYKAVLWREIAGTRDKIIHHYFGIDFDIVWEIIKSGLPELKEQMQVLKNDLSD